MPDQFTELEDSVALLCRSYKQQRRENQQLRDQYSTLLERNAALRARLENLLERVKQLETEVEA